MFKDLLHHQLSHLKCLLCLVSLLLGQVQLQVSKMLDLVWLQ